MAVCKIETSPQAVARNDPSFYVKGSGLTSCCPTVMTLASVTPFVLIQKLIKFEASLKLPLVEQAVARGSGAHKRPKSIITILIDVLAEARADLETIKSDHTARLDIGFVLHSDCGVAPKEEKFQELGESMYGSGLDDILSEYTTLEMEAEDQQTKMRKRVDEFAKHKNKNKKQLDLLQLGTASKNLRGDVSKTIVNLTILPFLNYYFTL